MRKHSIDRIQSMRDNCLVRSFSADDSRTEKSTIWTNLLDTVFDRWAKLLEI